MSWLTIFFLWLLFKHPNPFFKYNFGDQKEDMKVLRGKRSLIFLFGFPQFPIHHLISAETLKPNHRDLTGWQLLFIKFDLLLSINFFQKISIFSTMSRKSPCMLIHVIQWKVPINRPVLLLTFVRVWKCRLQDLLYCIFFISICHNICTLTLFKLNYLFTPSQTYIY